ncbi:chloramphenicol O-acetyltransferase type A [Epilithonimonas hungarica]|uniref:chloramphenicol acetyltransferase n=1 Tax=Epilithonimonas hungarica TaxID=454006 RepID=UPI00277E578B|nr:chloramphenicol acetyltransferase [Epilithonimonas hungarica]MDP9957391.1 chloramphenicol O-acetyltransferase type A [Epilithonimonas hungarica]
MKVIDIKNWKRKEHFEFFSGMKSPYFGIVTEVDCTETYRLTKDNNESFFAHYLHKSMKAVNSVEEFGYRIVNDEVIAFDIVHVGSTIARNDGTFGFSYFEYSDDFQIFNQNLQKEIDEVQNSTGLRIRNEELPPNHIRHSTMPWTHFTGLLHPTDFGPKESIPKIVFGKFSEKNGRKMLPISVEGHHGLMDGFHLAKYLEEFQNQLNLK